MSSHAIRSRCQRAETALSASAGQSIGPLQRLMTRREITGWSIPVGVGVASLILSLTLPTEEIEWAGWVYFSMAILVPLHSAYRKRTQQK